MEIFNNIWSLLTTSNEFITELIMLPLTFLEVYLSMMLFLTILNIQSTKISKIYYVVLYTIPTIIVSYIVPEPYNLFFNYLIFFILALFIFKASILKTLISTVSSLLIIALIGSLILSPYLNIFHITTDELANIPIYNFLYTMTIYLVTYLLILIFNHRNLQITFYDDIDKKSKMTLVSNFIFGIIALIVQTFILFYYVDTLPMIITFLSFISLLAYFIISVYSLTSIMKLTLTTKKLESAEEYNKTLHILHDNVRGFKHDFDNIVTTIGGYIRTEDIEGLKNYYLQLEDDCQKVNNLYLLNPEIVNNPRYI